MNPNLDRLGFAATAICLAGGLVLHAAWLPSSLLGVFVLVAAIASALHLSGRQPLPSLLRLGVMVLLGMLVVRTFGNPFGREAGSALLLAMLAAKMLETRTRRDARVVLTATCFVALAGFLFDQGPAQMLMALVVVVAILAALALLADLRLQPVDVRSRLLEPARTGARHALVAIPFAIVCFVLFPRLDSPLWGAPADAFTGRTGISDRMQPGMLSSLALDDTPVMRVRFDGEMPPPENRYFRGLVFWWFDGSTWAGKDALKGFSQAPELEPLGPAINYEVIIEPTDQTWLYALDAPRAITGEDLSLGGDFQLRRETPVTSILRYTGSAYLDYRMQADLPRLQQRLGLQLPPEGNPRARALAERWASETGGDARAIAERALGLFNAEFIYSLEPPLLARDAVDDFLFETRIGFCEHFASAFAFVMRSAGVPARVVVGYQGGIVNRIGGYLLLRRADAHAWTEIWIDGEGWVRIDPTAAVAPERIADSAREQLELRQGAASGSWLSRLRERSDLFGYWWNRSLIEFSALRQRQMLQSFGAPPDAQVLVALLAVAGSLALLLASWWLMRHRVERDPVLAEWQRFQRRLRRAGVEIAAHEGPTAVATRAAEAMPEQKGAIQRIVNEFVTLRYQGIDPESATPDARRLAALREAVRHFRPSHRIRGRIRPAQQIH